MRQVRGDPGIDRGADGLRDGQCPAVHREGGPIPDHELHRLAHPAPAEAFVALPGDQQGLVDVVVRDRAEALEVQAVEREGDGLHQGVAEHVGVSEALALDQLHAPSAHRLAPEQPDRDGVHRSGYSAPAHARKSIR